MTPLIAVIDDDLETQELIKAALELEGYRVALISMFDPILPQVEQVAPDVILLDLMIAGEDGYSLCRQLKQQPKVREIPILFVTGMPHIEQKTLAAGASGHLMKPFLLKELYQAISKLLPKGG